MIDRPAYLHQLTSAVQRSPITALLGPRQSGKTTLARLFAQAGPTTFFDLESEPDRQRLQNPELALGELTGLVVIDEIQTLPELFRVLRVLVDRPTTQARFLILGSASPDIIRNVSETLAGRVEFIELAGFDLGETGVGRVEEPVGARGISRAFLAASDEDSEKWHAGFIRTFLEHDIPQLGISIPAPAMRRLWTMLAHYHGQTLNTSELARSLGVPDKTVRSYLDVLTGTFMVRQLQPWFVNIGKRQVKAPKIYLRDSGFCTACSALGTGMHFSPIRGSAPRGGGSRSNRSSSHCGFRRPISGPPTAAPTRSAVLSPWEKLRGRGEIQRSAPGNEIHALRPGGSGVGPSLGCAPRPEFLSRGREGDSLFDQGYRSAHCGEIGL